MAFWRLHFRLNWALHYATIVKSARVGSAFIAEKIDLAGGHAQVGAIFNIGVILKKGSYRDWL